MRETVSLLANLSERPRWIDTLFAECDWSFEHAENLAKLREIGAGRDVVAVLIDPASLAMQPTQALRTVSEALPRALPILCHKASEILPWAQLAQAGAFHALLMPLHAGEVRQTLGFVSAQRRRRPRVVALHDRPMASSHRAQPAGIPA
jgi:DNA-binding NtrC family response regulator